MLGVKHISPVSGFKFIPAVVIIGLACEYPPVKPIGVYYDENTIKSIGNKKGIIFKNQYRKPLSLLTSISVFARASGFTP